MNTDLPPLTDVRRHQLVVRGQVQGVGFRPYVYRLAAELGLSGWVENGGAGVRIEVQGPAERLHTFGVRLHDAPAPARIVSVQQSARAARAPAEGFVIAPSRSGAAGTALAPDLAMCGDCLAELFQPGNRRGHHAFMACARCGPRFSLTRAVPFDRANTSMAAFQCCDDCRREYQDPHDRRFHAQVIACPLCGPRLRFHEGDGAAGEASDPIAAAVAVLCAGGILAAKGVGGFHLLCNARDPVAVAELRRRKGREAKPFAVMVLNPESVSDWAQWNAGERRWLEAPERPIVLLDKRPGCDRALAGIAPEVAELGVMLPYAPLHYLLFHHVAGRPTGHEWLAALQPLLLVCTSANLNGEPLLSDDRQALQQLRGIADAYLCHDRAIEQRCDDSVMRLDDGAPCFVRRARGFVPRPIRLDAAGPSLLAVGADLKNTFCLTRDDEAYVSQHNGDLITSVGRRALEENLGQWLAALGAAPQVVVHDRHPDFFTTRLAQRFAAERGLPCLPVQHHHAHIAAVAAEAGLHDAMLGVALDGFGLGDDGGLWGGELLRVEGWQHRRLGHLQPLALPGGERAAREPWRMAASALHALGRVQDIPRHCPYPGRETVLEMLVKRVNAPFTTSAGRWFDAAAAVLGIAAYSSYEGQAAMRLEALARRHGPVTPSRDDYHLEPEGVLNLLPLIGRLAREEDAGYGAALFHATLAAALGDWVAAAAGREGLCNVVLNGGCFMNALLGRGLRANLQRAGLNVYQARQLPPNDGGLSLGQAWIGRAWLAAGGSG